MDKKKKSVTIKSTKKPKKNGYLMPKPLNVGEILTDNQKKEWIIGNSIGLGGFGEIYSACNNDQALKISNDFSYVIKIEPKENGPLFVEMHFYMRNTKPDDIEQFKKKYKLKTLGMPKLIAMGSHEIQGVKHRFIVLPRFGKDIDKIFVEHNRKMPPHTVYRIGWQIINILEYIHGRKYVHNDIKGTNLLLGFGKNGNEQIHLIDFGLACHYNTKDFKPDPKKMHNGTIEYTSRDAHNGIFTMRGDLEILAFNLIEWSGGVLPWVAKNILTKPLQVQKMKEEFMNTPEKSLEKCFDGNITIQHSILSKFFKYLKDMNYDTVPDYVKIRETFEIGIKELGFINTGELEFKCVEVLRKAIEKTNERSKLLKVPPEELPQRKVSVRRNAKRENNMDQNNVNSKEDDVSKTSQNQKSKCRKKQKRDEMVFEIDNNEIDNEERKGQKKNLKLGNNNECTKADSKEIDLKRRKKLQNDKNNKAQASLILKSKKKNPNKKTIKLNFNLDVSLDSDLVVVVNRREKAKK